MTQDEIYVLVDIWVRAVSKMSGPEGVIAIRESETGPRPTSTKSGSLCCVPKTGLYVTMDIASDDVVQECGSQVIPDGECFIETQCCVHEITVDLQAYRCSANDFLSALRGSLKLRTTRAEYLPGLSVVDIGPITNISAIIKASKEERAAMTVTLGYVSTVSAPVACLELDCDPCHNPCDDEPPTEKEECH